MSKIIIIAEAGVNHNGSVELAKQMIDEASDAGADYIKFQTFKAEKNISRFAPKAEYQIRNAGNADTQLEMVKKLELNEADHYELQDYCRSRSIGFLSTAFDFESIDLLKKMGVTLGKIPSGEITNYPYLKKMAASFSEFILSTGMAVPEEIKTAVDILSRFGADMKKITILHCNTEYPTPVQDVNLKAMLTLGKEFNTAFGYSDHTQGIVVPIAAAALGASVIEKHFTLSREMEGPDHKASLEPAELVAMVKGIRDVEKALGDGVKRVTSSEKNNIAIARKSIVARRPISEGEVLTEDNLAVKRPGTGITPMKWDEVIGTKAVRNFQEDELIEL
jgi:N,N'-diacetyllegionaminate synthase